jgi:hypothetical protein
VRLHVPAGRLGTPAGVPEPQALGVPAGLRDGDQRFGVDDRGRPRVAPGGGHGDRPQGVHPAAQPRGHHLHHLGERPDRGFLDPGHRAVDRGLHPDRERHRLLVVHHQRGQRRARGQLVAAVDPAVGVDRIAELAQPVDVAAQGAHGDAEPVGQRATRPVAPGLQQGQQPQRPRARVGHGTSLSELRSESDRCAS